MKDKMTQKIILGILYTNHYRNDFSLIKLNIQFKKSNQIYFDKNHLLICVCIYFFSYRFVSTFWCHMPNARMRYYDDNILYIIGN